MNQQQLDALIQALGRMQPAPAPAANPGGTRKLSPLSSVEGADWRVWRRAFEQTALINNWNDMRGRREIYAAMEGEAARNTQDLEPGQFGNVADMLAAFEARFVPAADTKLCRAQFESARQLPNEQMTAWHARLRELFIRAFPGQAVEDSALLIDQFIKRMYDHKTAEWVINASPATYVQALATSQNVLANQLFLNGRKSDGNSKGGVSAMSEFAMEDGTNAEEWDINLLNATATCWFCKKTGHLRDDCREFKKMLEYFAGLFGVPASQYKANRGKSKKENKEKKANRKSKKKVQTTTGPEVTGN